MLAQLRKGSPRKGRNLEANKINKWPPQACHEPLAQQYAILMLRENGSETCFTW